MGNERQSTEAPTEQRQPARRCWCDPLVISVIGLALAGSVVGSVFGVFDRFLKWLYETRAGWTGESFGLLVILIVALVILLLHSWRIEKRRLAERDAIEEVLARERNLLRTIIDNLPDRVRLKDAAGRYVLANKAFLDYVHVRSVDEIIGKTPFEVFPADIAAELHKNDAEVINSGQPVVGEMTRAHYDGHDVWVLTTQVPLRDSRGKVTGLLHVGRDITDRKQIEDALAHEQHLLAALMSTTTDLVYFKDRESRFIRISEALAHRLGLSSAAAAVGKKDSDYFSSAYAQQTFDDEQQIIRTGQPIIDKEEKETWPDGHSTWVSSTRVPLRDQQGNIIGTFGISRDVTERKVAEEAVARDRHLLRTLIETIPDRIYAKDMEARFILNNIAHLRALDAKSQEEATGKTDFDFRPADVARKCMTDDQQVLRSGLPLHNREEQTTLPSGETGWILVNKVPLRNADGKIVGLVGISRDITERKQLEEQQQVVTAGLRAVVEVADELIACTDEDTVLRRAVELNREKLGLERCSIYLDDGDHLRGTYGTNRSGRTVDEHEFRWNPRDPRLPYPQTPPETGARWHLGNGPHFEWDGRDITCFDEGWRVVTPIYSAKRRIGIMVNDAAISKGAMKPAQQEVTAVFCSLLGNILEHKRLEGRFLQSQKMEAVGRLAGGVAHDFNNILTAILGYSDFILRDGYTGQTEEYAAEIKKAAERAAALTRQLLAFSRKQMLQPKVLDLNAAIAGMEGMLRRLIGENISLTTLPGRNLGRVKADLGQVEQIIMNLAVNARDAMREGGSLTIETGNVTFDEAYVSQHAGLSPGSYVMLAITDTGHGMTKEVMAHLFEPFFTTKGLGLGTGLGLATCYGIIKQSGGHITVYSEPGQGSTFRIYLPRVDQASDSQAKHDVPADMPRGSETILIVEDEISVRRLTALTMRELGYTILEACNGKDALRVVQERNGNRIDFVITDVTMPEMGGAELAHELAALHPETKILFVSGYTENTIVHQGTVDAGIEFLSKPYMPSALARKVREILDGPANSRK